MNRTAIFLLLLLFVVPVQAQQLQVNELSVRHFGGGKAVEPLKPNQRVVVTAEFLNSGANTTIEASTGLSGARWYVDSEKVAEGRSAEVVVGPGASTLEIKGFTPSTVYGRDVTMLSIIEPEVELKKEVSRGIVTYGTAAKLTATVSAATLAAGAVAGYMAGRRRHRKKMLGTVRDLAKELSRNGFTRRAKDIIERLVKL